MDSKVTPDERQDRIWALGGIAFKVFAPEIWAKRAEWCPKCPK